MKEIKGTPLSLTAGDLLVIVREKNGGVLPRCGEGARLSPEPLTLTLSRSVICPDPERFYEAMRRLRALMVAVILKEDALGLGRPRLITRAVETCRVHRGKDKVTVVLSEIWVRNVAEGYRWEEYF